jgi:hypothetical protein
VPVGHSTRTDTGRTIPTWHDTCSTRSVWIPVVVDEAIGDPTTHDEVRSEHDRVVAAGGYGVPTLFFPEFVGTERRARVPVRPGGPRPADRCPAALRLWDATTAWLEFPYLFELQRPKTRHHAEVITDRLRPYLDARDWVSINRGKVVSFD